jgi:ribosomal protein L11 methyltransferase
MSSNLCWYELVFQADSRHTEKAEEILYESGAVAVTLEDAADQPLLEPKPGETPLWDLSRVTGLFEHNIDPDALLAQLRPQLAGIALDELRIRNVAEQQWERAWMENYRPMDFGRRLSVYPSHIAPADTSRINLVLDPGLAFGTGTHPTTALCLRWLDEHDLAGKMCIDYGCGSGILAVAALKLGAAEVHAVDIDPQALTATRDNAQRNGIHKNLHTLTPDKLRTPPADIVLANILSNTLVELANTLTALLKPGGKLVMSGILADQAAAVMAAYKKTCAFDKTVEDAGWVLLAATKRNKSISKRN